MFTAGDWYPVCADDEWDAMAINRLCIDLGHTSGAVQPPQPLLSDTVIRTSVSCNASNEHLSECLPDNLDLRSGSQCPSNTVLTVACEATGELYTHLHSCSCAYKSEPHYFRTDSMCMLHRMRMPGYSLPRTWPPSFIPHACTQQTNMTLYNLCIDYTYICMHCLHTCRNIPFLPSIHVHILLKHKHQSTITACSEIPTEIHNVCFTLDTLHYAAFILCSHPVPFRR